jgi:hypothetical protein
MHVSVKETLAAIYLERINRSWVAAGKPDVVMGQPYSLINITANDGQ